MHVQAIMLCLGDAEFLPASVGSIYDAVDGITIVTTYDRDWKGRERKPDGLVEEVLSRRIDPDRKIDLIVVSDTSEAGARNRAMDLADPRPASRRLRRQHELDAPRPPVDYFWVLDADEVYDRVDVPRLLEYVAQHRAPLYRVAALRYFKTWRYRIDGYEWSTAFVRADVRPSYLRNWEQSFFRRCVAKALRVVGAPKLAGTVVRTHAGPECVAVFHHGSYVGPRERIVQKLTSFGHEHEVEPAWVQDVWDSWTPETKNFNPAWPELYPSATEIAFEELPLDVRISDWPAGYLE
jgi:hypothetical protein